MFIPYLQKGFLNDLFGIFPIFEHRKSKTIHPLAVPFIQLIKRLHIAFFDSPGQLLIDVG